LQARSRSILRQEISEDLEEQFRLVFEDIKELVKSDGGTLTDVLKTATYLVDSSCHQEYDRLHRSYFREGYSARSTVQARLCILASKSR
jgi:enamine deaminase RidA (YjgF/YER057c/UK114 family)